MVMDLRVTETELLERFCEEMSASCRQHMFRQICVTVGSTPSASYALPILHTSKNCATVFPSKTTTVSRTAKPGLNLERSNPVDVSVEIQLRQRQLDPSSSSVVSAQSSSPGCVPACVLGSRQRRLSLHATLQQQGHTTSGQSNLTKRPHHCWTWLVQSYSPGCANVHSHLTQVSLDLSDFTSQTSRSVQPFLHGSRHSVPIFYNGPPLSPSKLPLGCGTWTPSNTCFLGSTRVHNSYGASIRSTVFAGLMIVTDRPTD